MNKETKISSNEMLLMQQTNLMLTLFTKYLQDILYGYNETK